MDIMANSYQREALRTSNSRDSNDQLNNGVMGLCGEAGECIDIVKKYQHQGHELHAEHLVEELGDVLWYVAVISDAIGVSLGDVMKHNVNKLRQRYPNGFEVQRSVERYE